MKLVPHSVLTFHVQAHLLLNFATAIHNSVGALVSCSDPQKRDPAFRNREAVLIARLVLLFLVQENQSRARRLVCLHCDGPELHRDGASHPSQRDVEVLPVLHIVLVRAVWENK